MKAYVGIDLAQETFTATFLAEAGPLCNFPSAKSPAPASTPPCMSPDATAVEAASPNVATVTSDASSTSSPRNSLALQSAFARLMPTAANRAALTARPS